MQGAVIHGSMHKIFINIGRYDGTPFSEPIFSEPSRCGADDAGSGAAASVAGAGRSASASSRSADGTKNSEPVTARL